MQAAPIFILLLQLFLNPFHVSASSSETGPEYILREEVPIIMYHEIGIPEGPWKELYVDPDVFARQLDYLAGEGYTTINLQDLYEHWTNKKPLPEKPIVLTFDDGYKSVYETVYPLLQARKMEATFFLYPSKFGSANGLTPQMVKELAAAGMEIGSHTANHADLTQLDTEGQRKEILDSKTTLEEITNKSVNFLCYPSGRYNQAVISETEKSGYLGAVTTQMGNSTYQQDPYQWKRIRINYSDGLKGFINKIN
ncbi:MAG: polysaccharide deacetylase family protein [Peptococcaceae bacterium]